MRSTKSFYRLVKKTEKETKPIPTDTYKDNNENRKFQRIAYSIGTL